MHYHPKLILLNGPVGIGKTTIAQRYANDHPLTLALSGDDIIIMLGDWLAHEDLARQRAFELSKVMAATHLKAGYSVVMPHLLLDTKEADELERVAEENGARFFEVTLMAKDREEALARALERGVWGEGEPIKDSDMPILEDKYDQMVQTLHKRPHMLQITAVKGDVEGTYKQFLQLFDNK